FVGSVRQLHRGCFGRADYRLPSVDVPHSLLDEQEEASMNPASRLPAGLPALDDASTAHAQAMRDYLTRQVQQSEHGFMPFEHWMRLALYAPGLGYYAAGNTKFGAGMPTGDFTTAPELTPLFGKTLARQVAEILERSGSDTILEFGAGSGALAASILPALADMGISARYLILEVSADLRARQQERLADHGVTVTWLDALPEDFSEIGRAHV